MDKTRLKEEGYASIRDIENESRRVNIQNANETERQLGGQLITLSVLFLTVSVVILGSDDLFQQIGDATKVFVMLTFLAVVASIACGIKYYFVCAKYYADNSKIHHENYESIRNSLLNGENPDFDEVNNNGKRETFQASLTFLKWQIGLLGVGAALCTLLLFTLLFCGNSASAEKPVFSSTSGQYAPRDCSSSEHKSR